MQTHSTAQLIKGQTMPAPFYLAFHVSNLDKAWEFYSAALGRNRSAGSENLGRFRRFRGQPGLHSGAQWTMI
jgi:extradiol dioxygenase family protein